MSQMKHFEEELGLSKSQIVDEALSLFFKTVIELKQGWRIAFVDADAPQRVREFTSPALTQVEWATQRERIVLSNADFDRVQKMLENPPGPTPQLKAAVARRSKRRQEESSQRKQEEPSHR
ncbi:DUF1778 domain-containing protein [Archangium violaceum]|uniref:Uncharacterized protein n=1 Tax=Archangium violaceum Cb vi76 TaxID=1406225 RepID=A0A084SKV3_9BACT|nr:DUF1778 domain-containing protein [Archangium violaceum]KFA89088.1 hypothetical protein Q664_36960 [Archangium violaceum Cb vi76]